MVEHLNRRRLHARFAMWLAGALTLAVAASAHATVIHDESVDGELSSSYPSPTQLPALSDGTNTVTGTSDYQNFGDDFFPVGDNARFEVPAGWKLTGIDLTIDRTTTVHLYDVDASGNTVTPAIATDETVTSSTELLDHFGFTSLGAGEYVIGLFNNSGDTSSTLNYSYDLNAVPSPATLPMLALLGAPLLLRRRRRVSR